MTRERIIKTSIKLFCKYGIKGVTMDLIVQRLSISKRTLYENFYSKSHLIQSCVEFQLKQKKILQSDDKDLMDELIRCYVMFEEINHQLLSDIHKSYANTYYYLKHQIDAYAYSCSKKAISSIAAGYIRKDITPQFVACVIKDFLLKIFFCNGCSLNASRSFHARLFLIILFGMSTSKGCEYIKSQLF